MKTKQQRLDVVVYYKDKKWGDDNFRSSVLQSHKLVDYTAWKMALVKEHVRQSRQISFFYSGRCCCCCCGLMLRNNTQRIKKKKLQMNLKCMMQFFCKSNINFFRFNLASITSTANDQICHAIVMCQAQA